MELLEQHFDTAFAAPDGIKKLRDLILTLAMQGKLVPQDPNDPPASQLLKEIEAEKKRLVKEGKIKAPKPLPEIKPDEVPYALSQGWVWVRLGDISEYIQRGKGPSYSEIPEIPVISQKCIQWCGFDKNVVRFIDPDTVHTYKDERFICNGDLLWNSTGTGTIGRVNIYADELSEFDKVVADSHVTVVRLTGLCNSFVLSYLMSPAIQNRIEESASGTTNQIELNTTTVINQTVPLPPLPEQHRIVAKIDQLMARCDALEKLRAEREQKRRSVHTAALKLLLDAQAIDSFADAWQFITHHFGELYAVRENVTELRKVILQLAVMGKLVPQDPNDPPASQLLKEIGAEKKRLVKKGKIKAPKPLLEIKGEEIPFALPLGWEWVRLGDLGYTNIGLTYTPSDVSDTGIPVLRSNNIQDGKLDLSNLKRVDLQVKESVLVQESDLLICARNGSKALVGKTALITGLPEAMAFGAFMAIFRSRFNQYLLYFINSPLFRKMIDEVNTMTINQITQDNLRSTLCPLPPLAEQHRIVARIDQLMALCDMLEQRIDDASGKQTELLNALMAQV